jgi:hypothetical protein
MYSVNRCKENYFPSPKNNTVKYGRLEHISKWRKVVECKLRPLYPRRELLLLLRSKGDWPSLEVEVKREIIEPCHLCLSSSTIQCCVCPSLWNGLNVKLLSNWLKKLWYTIFSDTNVIYSSQGSNPVQISTSCSNISQVSVGQFLEVVCHDCLYPHPYLLITQWAFDLFSLFDVV